ncbi:holin [Eubacterium sp. AF15-50]|uniref:phage holin family protein n=1 Tax=unclassified Eubacterium (in: firmicutes) TaxID=2624479 RepID=UPI000E4EB2F3|nr:MULTISPECIES: phage holin family protein [unclassified Eubacterium (in: firmicutes)]RHR72639.1 holin [Eubacterium sp. AF16-48]RHR75711.1 holin [Eubacterium sp. AF15-50]
MDKANLLKKIVGAISSVLSSMLEILYIPVLLLVTCNVVDYTTGLIAAKYRDDGTISSYKSFQGIFKKISMWMLVVVGVVVDELLKYTTDTIGLKFPFQFLIACIVAVWLICNELISILENIKDAGVNIPAFLLPLVKNIKSQTETSVNMENEDKEK